MSGYMGYSLYQLLEWCAQDRLIEGYKLDGESVWILHEGVEKELHHVAAKKYLKGMFAGVERQADEGYHGSGPDPNLV